ncbi:MAG: hypothetical protein WC224_02590 [Sphaerochaetaceae bacterium]
MKKYSFFGSFMVSILLVVALFFVVYFFLPIESEKFFGFSYQSTKDFKHLKEVITTILTRADATNSSIQEYLDRLDEPENFQNIIKKEKKDLTAMLASIGEGINFGSLKGGSLAEVLREGLNNSSITDSKQNKAMQRILSWVESL